ncbi:nucleotidyltransferase family protein [Roseicella aquatilis]|nr:nucleotidyltransferase domain-containing protein [Roseicella aquatilis]
MAEARWLTVQEVDARNRAKRAAAREALPRLLAEASRGKPWHCILFGSLARGDFHPYSDADVVIVDGGEDWAIAEHAVHDVAAQLGVKADISFWEFLSERVRGEIRRDGIPCL